MGAILVSDDASWTLDARWKDNLHSDIGGDCETDANCEGVEGVGLAIFWGVSANVDAKGCRLICLISESISYVLSQLIVAIVDLKLKRHGGFGWGRVSNILKNKADSGVGGCGW